MIIYQLMPSFLESTIHQTPSSDSSSRIIKIKLLSGFSVHQVSISSNSGIRSDVIPSLRANLKVETLMNESLKSSMPMQKASSPSCDTISYHSEKACIARSRLQRAKIFGVILAFFIINYQGVRLGFR